MDSLDSKYEDHERRMKAIEEENNQISSQLSKARRHIKRLRTERVILLEEISDLRQIKRVKKVSSLDDHSDSDTSSESMLMEIKSSKKNTPVVKKKRDPNAPKGPGNVFFLYCRMERDNIKDKVANENLGEITRLLGQKWKALAKDEKQKYYDIYKKEIEKYESAMKSYTEAGGGAEGVAAVKANKLKSNVNEENYFDDVDILQDEEEDHEPPLEGLV
ncbi:high mobility group box domain-containing protein [Sporodiniella umbellata]|nr:high mobility group box domain-containing protein [Sporodiniella umbellata]